MATEVRSRTSYLAFAAHPRAVRCGRLHTRQVLGDWQLGHLTDEAELIVSELLTNAINAAAEPTASAAAARSHRAPEVILFLEARGDELAVYVWDACPQLPQRRPHDNLSIGGRGLDIVETMSQRWGWATCSSGKIVWACLAPGKPED